MPESDCFGAGSNGASEAPVVDGEAAATNGWPFLDIVPVAMLIADGSGTVLAANDEWREISGLAPDVTLGLGWSECVEPESRDALLAQLRETVDRGGRNVSDHRLAGPSGTRWTRWWVKRVGDLNDMVVVAVTDVDRDHKERDALLFRAVHDSLTGLANRAQFLELTGHALRGHARHPSHLAVLFVDLDGFKQVNDDNGHAWGDRVLVAVSEALLSAVRPEDVLARIGGDEFAVLCDRLDDPAAATTIVERIRMVLQHPLLVDGTACELSASVGVAYADGSDAHPEEILDRADRAMYEMKRQHASGHQVSSRNAGVRRVESRDA